MVGAFEQAAFSMQPGEIKGVVKSDYGYHVIKLLARIPPGRQSLAEATPRIAATLSQDQVRSAEARKVEALVKALPRNPSDEDLRKLADDVVSFDATDWLTPTGMLPGIGYAPNVLKAAFAMKKGEVSRQAIQTPRGSAIVKVTDVKEPGIPDFAEAKSKVAAEFTRRRTEDQQVDAARPLLAELRGGSTLDAIAKRFQVEVKTPAEFGRGAPVPDLGSSPGLGDAVFKTRAGEFGDPVVVAGKGVVIFRVVSKKDFDPTAFAAQRRKLEDAARQQEAQRLIEAEIARRRPQEKIIVNEDALKRYIQG
jgi:peptidyl-prolyl cis-trans isomerase D